MKRLGFFIMFAVIALHCLDAYAFSASYEQVTSGTGIPGSQRQLIKIKDEKIRIEMDMPGGKTITIVDGLNLYSYTPSKNTAIRLTSKSAPKMDVLSDYGAYLESINAKVIGSERIKGYNCDIYEFMDPRVSMMSKVWLWKEKNFPVKVETKVPDGVITTIMKNVKIGGDIPNSEFTLPEGVEVVDATQGMLR